MKNKKLFTAALLCAALMAFALAGCGKTEDDPTAGDVNPQTPVGDVNSQTPAQELTEKEYEDLMTKNYDELMAASEVASQAMDSVNMTEEPDAKVERLKAAMEQVELVIPHYKNFLDINAPEKYKEAQEMIQSGATASGEVLRLTVEMATAAEDEDRIAEVRMLQKQMDDQTPLALDFSKGLQIVLGDRVGTGEDTTK